MLQVLNGPAIEAGESESDGIDCSGGQLVRITMPPAEWDDAVLTFQFSSDGVFYNDMFGLDGFAVTIKEVVPGSGVIIPADVGRAIAWIKFRSGTRGNPVEQRERRQFAVTILTDDTEDEAPAPPARRSVKKKVQAKKSVAKKKGRR
jgi:hypothetical protein